jgi:hypothetical protein
MGKSSGGGQPSQVSTITVPEYAKGYMETLLGRGQALSDTPTPQYGGQAFADPTIAQREIRERARNLQLPAGFRSGRGMAIDAGQQARRAAQYNPYAFSMERIQAPRLRDLRMQAAQVDPSESSRYMSPYMQQVVDVQKRKAIEDAQQSQLLQNLQSARRGTLGGGRQAVLQAQREKALGQQLGDIQATGQQKAFEQAQQVAFKNLDARQQANVQNLASQLETQGLGARQAFDTALQNQIRSLETQRAAEASRQFGAGLGLKGISEQRLAGATAADIARQEGALELEQMKLQQAIARQRQIEDQRRLDFAQQQFQQRQLDPYKRLQFMSDLLRGTSSMRGGEALYQAPQTALQQIVGVGLPAYGLYRGLSGQG